MRDLLGELRYSSLNHLAVALMVLLHSPYKKTTSSLTLSYSTMLIEKQFQQTYIFKRKLYKKKLLKIF